MGSNDDTPNPFVIGLIEDINNQKIKVRIFCRPENTLASFKKVIDLNCIYYTDKGKIYSNFIILSYKLLRPTEKNDNIRHLCSWQKKTH